MCLSIPGEVLQMGSDHPGLATVDVRGVPRAISLDLLSDEQVAPGDWVLIHLGFAMSKIDKEEAEATLAFLNDVSEACAADLARTPESSALDGNADRTGP
ncbi:MAG: HypC/HybG/HupF family hydrogenase formation chaperone [Actinomycetota bacterium]|nr:HypC/HybG/HupF family hydrogenase formation chaperone [Actinomycetota bacterium]